MNGPPSQLHVSSVGRNRKKATNRVMLTANFLGELDELRKGELTSFDTTGHWPFALIFNSLDHNIREILHRSECNLHILASVWHNGSAILEVELGLEGAGVIRGFVRVSEVV